eukprot:1921765-Amphidinium_carterae.1
MQQSKVQDTVKGRSADFFGNSDSIQPRFYCWLRHLTYWRVMPPSPPSAYVSISSRHLGSDTVLSQPSSNC